MKGAWSRTTRTRHFRHAGSTDSKGTCMSRAGARRSTRAARLSAPIAAVVLLTGGLTALSLGPAAAAPAKVGVADDFNGDGYGDLVVGAPNAKVSGKARAGYVTVLYGSKSGASAAKKKLISRSTSGVPGAATANQRFGSTFTKGDLDRDGYGDLVIAGGTAGSVILWGSASGLTGGTSIAKFGSAPQAGDFDGDGKTDLALFSAQDISGDDPRARRRPCGRARSPARPSPPPYSRSSTSPCGGAGTRTTPPAPPATAARTGRPPSPGRSSPARSGTSTATAATTWSSGTTRVTAPGATGCSWAAPRASSAASRPATT